MPWSFIASITRSTPSAPICRPKLPPETVKNAGALQPPLVVLQVATPLPCCPPMPNPPLIICGTMATHFAPLKTFSGMPLSGAAVISCRTVAALSSRLAASVLSSAATKLHNVTVSRTESSFFMSFLPPMNLQADRGTLGNWGCPRWLLLQRKAGRCRGLAGKTGCRLSADKQPQPQTRKDRTDITDRTDPKSVLGAKELRSLGA